VNAVELLEPDKLVGVIACSESIWVLFRPVAFHTTFKIGGNAGVENFVTGIRCLSREIRFEAISQI
jgi:hypothetical protein